MLRRHTLLGVIALSLAACRDRAPEPTFAELFPPVTGEFLSRSSPQLADLNRDGVPDIVFGTGVERLQPGQQTYVLPKEPASAGHVVAISGADNRVLWKAEHGRDAFTTPRFLDINRDGSPDVIMGGREGVLAAYSGVDGKVLWRVRPDSIARTPFPYNFFTPALITDKDGDGLTDLLVVYGGDDTRLPNTPRDPSYITIISSAHGGVLAVQPTPDGKESYSSIVVYERNGEEWFVFGTGGETDGGAAYRAPVSAVVDRTLAQRAELLVSPGPKGVIAPATLVELTNDSDLDIVISTFDGRLIAVDGATRELLWQDTRTGEETYHGPAVVRIARDGRLGLLLSRGVGSFPRYSATVHRLYDARDGRLYLEHKDNDSPGGAPLGVDLSGDGIDELIFFSFRYPAGQGGRMTIVHGPSKRVITHTFRTNFGTTPLIAELKGKLELIGLSWWIEEQPQPPSWRNLRWELLRLDLSEPAPSFMAWAGYMGTQANGIFRAP